MICDAINNHAARSHYSQTLRTDIPLPSSLCVEKLRGKIEPYTHAYLSNGKVAFTRAKENTYFACCHLYNDDQTSYNINLRHARAKAILI